MDECVIFLSKDINNLLCILTASMKSFYALKRTASLQFFLSFFIFFSANLYFTSGCHTVMIFFAVCFVLIKKIPIRSLILFLQKMMVLL